MTDEEKKHDSCCCCCKCWKIIFITLALLIIGAIFGHAMTMKGHCCMMGGPGGGWGMKACWDKDGAEHHGWWGHKEEMGKHQPGCMCPMCYKKSACPAEPNKAGCPMMGKEQGKPAVQQQGRF
jgi:hypothetical protein